MIVALLAASMAAAQEYHLGAGDTVRVTVFGEAQLSAERLVPSNCNIGLQLIGDVAVCGRPEGDIAREIEARYADGYLNRPRVQVEVSAYGSQTVEVKGAVHAQGVRVLTGPTTLSRIITLAGGPSGENVVEVDIFRVSGEVETYQISKLEQMDSPVYVETGDVVNVRQGRNVYLGGEVAREGPVPYREGMTVSQALRIAGGRGELASNRGYVLKKSGERVPVNLRRIEEGLDHDLVLEPDDQLVVRSSVF